MRTIKNISLLILLCLWGIVEVHAQLGWARSFDINAAIPGASWSDISNVLRVSQDRYIVSGTINGPGYQGCVVARFSPDGVPGWVCELKGPPGTTIKVNDIAESKNAANPGYAICGQYQGTQNYLARIDDLGNLQWDRVWGGNQELVAVVFTAAANIVTIGSAISPLGVLTTNIYRFNNLGGILNSKQISTDPTIQPVDLLEDPTFNGTGGFFILANFRNVGSGNNMPYVIFVNNLLNVVQAHTLNYPPSPPAPPFYTNTRAVRFEQDLITRELYVLANPMGNARSARPSIIRFNPVAGGGATCVVLAPPPIPPFESLEGTDLTLINGDVKKGIMVTTTHQTPGGTNTYTWRIDGPPLNTTDFFQQWLAVSNVRNMSLIVSGDLQHYVLAGHDAGNYLTLNMVNLNGDKVNNAGASQCINPVGWTDEHPKVTPTPINYSAVNISISPFSVSNGTFYSWWYDNACWCAEESAKSYYRYAYPQIPYDNWELDINRAGYNRNNGNLYITNTMDLPAMDQGYEIELNASGLHMTTTTYMNVNPGGSDEDGRQTFITGNGEKIIASRIAVGPNLPVLNICRRNAGGGVMWQWHFPGTRTPGRVYVTEIPLSRDIVAVADIEGVDENSNTHDLMIARFSAGGALLYYKEVPITYNGMQRDYFRVHSVEATRDGYAVCGSSGQQNADFIAGHVLKFDGTGPTGVLDWQYVFRRQTPGSCYDLNMPGCRSASVFYSVRQNGGNGYYVAGYTSDHDANGQNATFWNGLLVQLDNLGNELAVQEYIDGSGRQTTFKGEVLNAADVAVVGELVDPAMPSRTDLFVRIDRATFGVMAAQTYGHGDNSSLLDIFNSNAASGNVFTMVGSTTDWYGRRTPQVIGTDVNGSNGCEISVSMSTATPVNDPVRLDLDVPIDYTQLQAWDEYFSTCVEVFDICQPVTPAFAPGGTATTGISKFGNSQNNKEQAEIEVYPNPASTLLNLRVPQDVKISELSIVDISGKVVYHGSAAAMDNLKEINISALPEGMYAVKMETNTGKRYTRFIKL